MMIHRTACSGLVLALVACANRPAPADDPSPAVSTVQVVERKPTATPDFSMMPREAAPPVVAADVDASIFACTDTSECTVIETGCCDHCNGGALLSIAAAHERKATDAFRQRSCASAGECTERACEWTFTPVCDQGTCARLEDRPLGTAAAQMVLVHNTFIEADGTVTMPDHTMPGPTPGPMSTQELR